MKASFALLAVAFAAFSPAASALTADDLASLELRSPHPTANNLSVAISLSNDEFVVAGSAGTIALSSDAGETWTSVEGPAATNWTQGASNGEDLHVLLGPSTWAISEDGLTWSSGTILPYILPTELIYGAGRFVTIGSGGIRHSEDGKTWTQAILNEEWTWFTGILYDGSRYLTVSIDKVLVSNDGEIWSELSTLPSEDVRDVSHAGDTYCATGRNGLLYTSEDAITWIIRDTGVTYPIEAAFKAHGRYYLKGSSGNLLITEDFETFERASTLVSGVWSLAMDDTSETMVACGLSGAISQSLDGALWTDQRDAVGSSFGSVAFGNGVFVTAELSSGTFYRSTDGIAWQASETSAPLLSDIVFYRDQFRCIGNFGLMTSPDGETWTTKEGPGNVGGLNRLLVLNERLIGVLPLGKVVESIDGETWTEHVLPTSDRLEHATYGKGLYVVVGKGESIFTSPDLRTWTAQPLEETSQLKRVHFGGTNFYAFSNLRRAPLVSTDGILWEVPEDMPLMTGRHAMWDPELGIYFVISGFFQWHPPGTDPTSWESSPFPNRLEVSQVATSPEGIVVAVGDDGLIMSRSPRGKGYSDWVSAHFPGSDANSTIDADPDNDGQSNLEEYAAGTDPAIANTPLSATELNASEGDVTLSWKQTESADDVEVNLEFSQDLRTWQTIEDPEIDDRSEIVSAIVALPNARAPRYYRLRWDLK